MIFSQGKHSAVCTVAAKLFCDPRNIIDEIGLGFIVTRG